MARQEYVLDGNRQFIFPFPVRDASDLRLQVSPGTAVPQEDYTVTGAGPASQGVTVQWSGAPTNPELILTIIRETPPDRVTDFPNNQAVSARALNAEFDNVYAALQDLLLELWGGEWEPETTYALNTVLAGPDGNIYRTPQLHTSSTDFEADLSEGLWQLVVDFTIGQDAIDTALAAAEQARDDSQTAQGLSEDARDASEDARDAAQTAQGLSEDARDTSVASLADFRSRYYGELASDPTTDPNGDPINAGDLYWNNSTDTLRIYNGTTAAWQDAGASTAGLYQETATEGQTAFTITGGYTVGFILVFLNGVRLSDADFTADDGSTVVLASGATADDVFSALSFGTFDVANTYTKDETDALLAETISGVNGFYKTDSTKVAWTKTGNGTAETNQDLTVFVGGGAVSVPSGTSIAMPALTVGTDYAIWCAPDGTLEADESYSVAPTTGGRRVGGFHYAPGGNASFEINAGDGNTTPQINKYSFHDLKWKPAAPDPRGLTLVGDGAFWCGIYHLVQDHLSGPPHRHGVSPARDGNAPQLITGVGNYPDAQPMNLFEVLAYHGLRSPRVEDFQLLAFGTNEETSRGSDPVTTGLPGGNTDAQFTSHWGVIQSTGVIRVWSNDSILSTSDQTLPNPPRGGRFRVLRFASLGGSWNNGAASGSRALSAITASASLSFGGSRGITDHLILP